MRHDFSDLWAKNSCIEIRPNAWVNFKNECNKSVL